MEIKLDRFGRVVLPKAVRDDLDLEPGDIFAVEEVDEGILLRPVHDEPSLVEKDGILVFVGELKGDIEAAVEKLRGGRLRRLADSKRRRR